MKIYGPYIGKDGRKRVVIVNEDGSKRTKSYPRLLMEQHLGRELTEEETVDHINNDFTDDRIENLQILSREENASKAMIGRNRATHSFTCPCCGKESVKYLADVKHNRSKAKSGPYCSRQCAGKATYINPWETKKMEIKGNSNG
jgi:hypothetical protein